uniref:Uncharacterized protein n=1 Tax=Photinus pyralis TaxID=7054 RepID=A0A1Y1LG62_PHOPY
MATGSVNILSAPDKPCKKCNNIPLSGLKCVSGASLIHPGCAKYLKNLVILSETAVNCCGNNVNVDKVVCNDKDVDAMDDNLQVCEGNRTEIDYLKAIIKQKDFSIQCLNDTVASLKEQLKLINFFQNSALPVSKRESKDTAAKEDRSASSDKKKLFSKVVQSERDNNSNQGNKNVPTPINTQGNVVSNQKDTNNQTNTQQSKTKSQRNNIDSSTVPATPCYSKENVDKEDFIVVKSRKKTFKNRSLVAGSSTTGTLLGVEKQIHFHVCRLHPSTTEENLTQFLSKNDINGVTVTKLNSKFPNIYSSFRLSANENLKEVILNPNLWPSGVLINRFFWSVPKTTEQG